MKVKDLIEALKNVDPERVVVMSRDAEGNGYSYYYEMSEARFDGYSIGLEPDELTDELQAKGYSEDDVMEDGEPVVVLWPV